MYYPYPPHIANIPTEDITAKAGQPLAEGVAAASSDDGIIAQLQEVYDPEIPVNIYDLGLIYEIKRKGGGDVEIIMTVTAPACPVAGELPGQVAEAAARAEGVGVVDVTLTWDPPWTPARMSEAAQIALDMF